MSLSSPSRRGGKWPGLLAWLSVITLIVAGVLMLASGPAFRMDAIELSDAFGWLRLGAQLAAAAAVLGIVTILVSGLCRRWGAVVAGAIAAVLAVMMIAMPAQLQQRARTVPPIHDITTDMANPPAFVALAPAREAAPNAVAYPGANTAQQQQAAYPKLQPVTLAVPLDDATTAVRNLIGSRGWELAADSPTRFEATATTRWFGFKDDVVIRLTDAPDGVRVDMRSASRLGKSDLGTNAERIQSFLEDLQNNVQ